MMQRELIDKYFRNECSDDEKQQVLEYFQNNPEEWNKYISEDDWDNFTTNEELDPGLTRKLFKNVSRHSFKKGNRAKTAWLAAAVLAGLAIGLLWYQAGKKNYDAKSGAVSGALAQMAERRNASDTLMRIVLDDGSVVILSPNSSIRFYEPFVSHNSRMVYLWGKALFKVAGDKARPFVVYSDRLATTVLGTHFTVQAFAESDVIKVKLHQGKVQVAAVDTIHEKWKDKAILLPGDELTYNKLTMLASITRKAPAEQMVKAGPANREMHTVRRPDWYTFDISPLAEVFDQLSSYYQVDIYYYPSDIQNKYFSGRMHKTDTLETILNDIAVLNQLTIEKQQGHYFIRKKN
ncbi:MAG TPA: FecR domain-containing protein [Chitinophaga sp.]|uniref:FecR family protein n=1 Tax=Chitinophaga sp. TaxID=1869181 RepID=UPI002DBF0496|nr:FecR domain-containing protein [Chitinophaga sp.]HEU4551829.1 FecR domain-containing protein [Chitinophaga sp.]